MTTVLFIFLPEWRSVARLRWSSQRNPLYSAISLIGVFISLASLYVMLAAPFIAAVQVIVYAGAIMVLVVFVIMLLNVEDAEPRRQRLRVSGARLAIGAGGNPDRRNGFHSLFSASIAGHAPGNISDVGLTASIGSGLFTTYLLPFEITSILLADGDCRRDVAGAHGRHRCHRRRAWCPGHQVLAMRHCSIRGAA